MNTIILTTLLTCIGTGDLKLTMNVQELTFSLYFEEKIETGNLRQRGANWAGPVYELLFADGEILRYLPGHDGESALLDGDDERMQLVNCSTTSSGI